MAEDGSQQRKPNFKRAVADAKELATALAMEAESILGKRTARFLGVLVLFAAVVVTLLALLDWYIAPSGAGQKQDLVVTLAQILGGAALLSGLYFTWRTLQINREGQITERFTRAIDQLGKVDDTGNKLFEIRVGGVYALQRIAKESEEDYWPIMEILTAYVRQHAPWPPEEGQGSEADSTLEDKSVEDSTSESGSTEGPPPGPDIQAILTVLRRRTRSWEEGESERLDLRSTNLQGANLQGANLQGASIWEANLQGATLQDANLQGPMFLGVELEGGANLQGANLQGANFQEARVTEAQLTRSGSLTGATMPNGQRYEDWLKDKEGSGKDVENQ